MSHALYAFLPVRGERPEATAQRRLEVDTERLNPGPPKVDAEARKARLVHALLAQNPGLERFTFDLAEIARFEGISEEEAQRQNRQIELNEPADGHGTQIILYDDWAEVSLPAGDLAGERDLWIQVWKYLRVLEASGFFVYDPQAGEVIDLDENDPDPNRETRDRADRTMKDGAAMTARPERPWWKFW
jgi:hypothetical protein